MMAPAVKFCPRCKEILPIEAFIIPRSGRQYGYCRKCLSSYQRERSMRHIDKKPVECGICGMGFGVMQPNGEIPIACADHDHETGVFRDWLCGGCNKAIGFFRESPWVMRKAADYIEKHFDDVPTEIEEILVKKPEHTQNSLIEQLLSFRNNKKEKPK